MRPSAWHARERILKRALRGSALGRRLYHQVTAAAVTSPNPEANLWSMVLDIDVINSLLSNQDRIG